MAVTSETNTGGGILFTPVIALVFKANARFPLSCDPLRTPRLAIRSWSWNFSEISGLDTRWCESIRSDTICCARMRSGHDLSISGVTICHGLISRSDTITYVPIDLFRSSPRLSLDLTRSPRSGSPNWDDLVRADTFRYVHHEPMRSVRIEYDCGRDVFHDHDRGWSRFELRLDPDGYIYSPTDHGLHCFLNFYRVNTTTLNRGSRSPRFGSTIRCDLSRFVTMQYDLIRWSRLTIDRVDRRKFLNRSKSFYD